MGATLKADAWNRYPRMLRAAQRYRLSGISIQKTTENLLTNQILLDSTKYTGHPLGTKNEMVGDPW